MYTVGNYFLQFFAQALIMSAGTLAARVPGIGQITWWIMCWQKSRGHIRKNLHKNREIVVQWTVEVWEHTNSWLGAQMVSVLKLIKTLKEYFWCHIYCAHLGIPWYQIVGASRTVFNRESRYPPRSGLIPGPSQRKNNPRTFIDSNVQIS